MPYREKERGSNNKKSVEIVSAEINEALVE